MELRTEEIIVEAVEFSSTELKELGELALAAIAGGCGETIVG